MPSAWFQFHYINAFKERDRMLSMTESIFNLLYYNEGSADTYLVELIHPTVTCRNTNTADTMYQPLK